MDQTVCGRPASVVCMGRWLCSCKLCIALCRWYFVHQGCCFVTSPLQMLNSGSFRTRTVICTARCAPSWQLFKQYQTPANHCDVQVLGTKYTHTHDVYNATMITTDHTVLVQTTSGRHGRRCIRNQSCSSYYRVLLPLTIHKNSHAGKVLQVQPHTTRAAQEGCAMLAFKL